MKGGRSTVKRSILRRTALAVALCLLFSCLPGCAGAKTARDRSVFAMDTVMDLRIYAADDSLLDELATLLAGMDSRLSALDPDSALSLLNRTGSAEDPELAALIGEAAAISARTGGALDISLYPVSKLWGFPGETQLVPAPGDLEALRGLTGMDRITLEGDRITLEPGTELDFGALAKGWAADQCRARMEAAGVSGILSLGGSIQTVGAKPDGSPWTVAIQDPDDPGAYRLVLRITGSKAVVTSGDYQRYFTENGVRYCHILDPETLSPVQGSLRSVTVVADSGLLADGLSTALFVMGKDAGIALWRRSDDFEAIWIEADGAVTVTAGLADAIDDNSVTVVKR